MTQLEYVDYLKRKLDAAGVTYRKLDRYDDEAQQYEQQKIEIERLTEEKASRRVNKFITLLKQEVMNHGGTYDEVNYLLIGKTTFCKTIDSIAKDWR